MALCPLLLTTFYSIALLPSTLRAILKATFSNTRPSIKMYSFSLLPCKLQFLPMQSSVRGGHCTIWELNLKVILLSSVGSCQVLRWHLRSQCAPLSFLVCLAPLPSPRPFSIAHRGCLIILPHLRRQSFCRLCPQRASLARH